MITISNRIELIQGMINEARQIQMQKEQEIFALEEQLRQPAPWHEDTPLRIVISSDDAVKLMINAKALIDYLFESDITAIKESENTYVYVSYLLPEHETILKANGAEVEVKS